MKMMYEQMERLTFPQGEAVLPPVVLAEARIVMTMLFKLTILLHAIIQMLDREVIEHSLPLRRLFRPLPTG